MLSKRPQNLFYTSALTPPLATLPLSPPSLLFRAYVTNRDSGTVSVLDTLSNTVVATIPVGDDPMGVALTSDGSRAYVTNYSFNPRAPSGYGYAASSFVSVIDTLSNTVIAKILVGSVPIGIVITPDGSHLYVTNSLSNNVSVIDTGNNTVVATIPVGTSPDGIAISPDGSRVYVVNNYNGGSPPPKTISVIDTLSNTVVATITVGLNPHGIAITPDGIRLYVVEADTDTVSVINTLSGTLVATIRVGQWGPYAVAITPDGKHAYVTNSVSHSVSVINTLSNTVIAEIPIAASPAGVAITPDGSRAYITKTDYNSPGYPGRDGYVSVIDTKTNTIVTTIKVGSNPHNIAIVTPNQWNLASFGSFEAFKRASPAKRAQIVSMLALARNPKSQVARLPPELMANMFTFLPEVGSGLTGKRPSGT